MAVVVPVVVVALLVAAGIFFWRKRKQRKAAEEDRRKEVEDYGFNPNHDPTLPAVGGYGSEMAEDSSGYRGWGNATNTSNRKASTTLSGGLTAFSDSGSQPGGYHSPGSPTNPSAADSGEPLMNRRETMDSEGIGALGGAPVANNPNRQSDIHRGPSNASSSYSGAGRSDSSENGHMQYNNPQDYYSGGGDYGYQAYNPHYDGQPVVQNVAARRNTRIENPAHYPPQGNSGIAQNF